MRLTLPAVGQLAKLRGGCQPPRAPIGNRLAPLLAITAVLAAAQTPAALHIAPNDLKADVSFLASDALEGRATPSQGLDVAAEFIASQFRREGLEPAGDDGYFQTAAFTWEPVLNQLKPATPGAPRSPSMKPVKLRNVAAILRGSDPALRDTYLLMTAHYDHLGILPGGEGDRIYNGANDDASGVASLLEIAHALMSQPARPRRSIVFLALFGEELGGLGSRYYVRHPLVPLAKTIADINIEQLGRTDDSGGTKLLQFNLTGFDYTTMAETFQKAAAKAGVRAVKDPKNSDAYFARSDSASFANAGVPATTVSVTYMFPDYHAVGDEWPKLDYNNMAKVDAALALAALDLANSASAPRWNPQDPGTARYIEAREAHK
jgi:hypothetical protein